MTLLGSISAWFFEPAVKVSAAEADILFMTDDCRVYVGDTVYVDMTIIADEKPGNFEGYLLYSSDILEFVSGPDMIMGGEGVLRISDFEFASESNIRTYELVFKAVDMGTAELSMRGNPSLYTFEDDEPMEVTCNRMKLIVEAAGDASSNALLSNLKVNPGTLSPAFSTDVNEYRVEVSAETEHLTVSAVSADDNAKVRVIGNDNLAVGENRILVNVTAEDGKENDYVIYCKRAEKENEAIPTGENITTPVEEKPDGNSDKASESGSDNGDGSTTDDDEKNINDEDNRTVEGDNSDTVQKEDSDKSTKIYIIVICILACALVMMIIICINQRNAQKEAASGRKKTSGNGNVSGKKTSSGNGTASGKKTSSGNGAASRKKK